MIYQDLLRANQRLQPDALYQVDRVTQPIVALTIDDGPSPRTREILRLLQQHQSQATFFLHTDPLTRDSDAPALVTQMLAQGHEIAHHMPADRPSFLLSPTEFATEFARAHQCLSSLAPPPRFFRPARGIYHSQHMLPILRQFGYWERFVLASFFPWDVFLPLPEVYARQLARASFPGAILVLHDGLTPGSGTARLSRTLQTLTLLLTLLRDRGYRVETLSQVLHQASP